MYLNFKISFIFYVQKHKKLVAELIFKQKIRCLLCERAHFFCKIRQGQYSITPQYNIYSA